VHRLAEGHPTIIPSVWVGHHDFIRHFYDFSERKLGEGLLLLELGGVRVGRLGSVEVEDSEPVSDIGRWVLIGGSEVTSRSLVIAARLLLSLRRVKL